ncbi:MAG: hypothetical protein ACPG6B_04045 [Oceanihabitans sp.]
MKTLLFGLLFIGFANLNHAQVQEVTLANVVISPLNASYLNAVHDSKTPEIVRKLENKAARFDITESPVFDKQFEAYEVIFTENDKNRNSIIATYDSNGKILKSYEKFKDVSIPHTVRNAVYNKFPDWKIFSDTYLVTYYTGKTAKRVFKLKIEKDNKKKTLKVDIDGNLI